MSGWSQRFGRTLRAESGVEDARGEKARMYRAALRSHRECISAVKLRSKGREDEPDEKDLQD